MLDCYAEVKGFSRVGREVVCKPTLDPCCSNPVASSKSKGKKEKSRIGIKYFLRKKLKYAAKRKYLVILYEFMYGAKRHIEIVFLACI